MQADGYCANFVLATSSDDIADIKKEPTPQMQRNHTKKEQTIAPSIVVEPETAQDSSTRSASADAEVLKSLNHVQTSENGPVGANSGQSNKKAPLFRPSTSPAPSSQQADDHDHVQDMDLQAQLEADDFTIPFGFFFHRSRPGIMLI